VLVGVAVAIGWLVLASVLVDSAVPGDLELPPVDVDATFGTAFVDEAERYERLLLALWVLSQVALFAVLVVYARRGAVFARESAAGPIGTGMLLGMLGLAMTWAVGVPFGLVALWWDRRHGVSEVGLLEHLLDDWLTLAASFVAVCVALLVVMALARWLGEWWWLPGAAVFTAIVFTFAWGAPALVTGLTEPDDPALLASYERFQRDQGVSGIPLRIESVSGDTSQANAYAFGLLGTRAIVLWDTLLDGRFTDGEVNVVLAHEVAHHSSRHIAEAIGWFALFAVPGAWLLMRLTRRRGGMSEAQAVPLALLVVAGYQLAVAPLQNWVGRGMEKEADWKALQTTRDPDGARGLFEGFSQTSLGDPSPPTWAYLFLASHPSLAQRVAMVDAWEARRR
jgi:STE24 endopeptidase